MKQHHKQTMEKKISKIADTFLVDSDQLQSLDLHVVRANM